MPTNHVEADCKLDIRLLAREGALAVGCECSVRWNAGGGRLSYLRIQASEGELHFSYDVNTQNGRSEAGALIKVTWTPCHYGGSRPWSALVEAADAVLPSCTAELTSVVAPAEG